MKTLYLECNMGAAGDMLMAALLELHPDPEAFLHTMNHLGLPGVTVTVEKKETCGILGTHVHVFVNGQEEGEDLHSHMHDHAHEHPQEHGHDHHDHDHGDHEHSHSHHHASLGDITHMISHLELPEQVKDRAAAVYRSIAEAESQAHGKPVTEVHFHEVGTWDAVADVVGVCLLLHELQVDEVVASPVHVGCGHVHCAHGVLPVPAPATASLLEGIPTYGREIQGELCTPTGAALLRQFVTAFGPMPVMAVEKTGYGVGTKEFPRANMLRAMLGTRTEESSAEEPSREKIAELSCNIDDMTAEEIAFAAEVLREAGALEVYTTAVTMKKDRAGVVFTCICRREDREEMAKRMFRHLSTLGIREKLLSRYVLERSVETRQTELGPVRVKVSRGFGTEKEKPEFEDLKAIAKETGMSLREIRTMLP